MEFSIMTCFIHSREVRYFSYRRLKPWCSIDTVPSFTQSKMVWGLIKIQANHCASPQPHIPPTPTSFGLKSYAQLPSLLRYHSCHFAAWKGTFREPTPPSSIMELAKLIIWRMRKQKKVHLTFSSHSEICGQSYLDDARMTGYICYLILMVLSVQWNLHHGASPSTIWFHCPPNRVHGFCSITVNL
jgi:hypothetical protein